jgi:pimeloyl-ACP methyl ester carboxylesterase
VTSLPAAAGHTRNGLPYNRFGSGPRTAVVFQGLLFENKPLTRLDARFVQRMYRWLEPEYTVYIVTRKKGLPEGCTLADMSDDYAEMIAAEFDGPVDVIGTSTGGSIALQFGADHGELARRLVIHSGAYRLGPAGKDVQLRLRDLVQEGEWRRANATLMEFALKPAWYRSALAAAMSVLMTMRAPDDPSDLITTIEAEDAFDLRNRLGEIAVPTLVLAGAADPFYTEELFRQTAQGIPGAQLVLYPGMGHPARGTQSERDLRAFLLCTE